MKEVTLRLPAEIEESLRARAHQEGLTLEGYLADLAAKACNGAGSAAPGSLWEKSDEEWIAALHRWSDSHSDTGHFVDDSRESIYEGRGE